MSSDGWRRLSPFAIVYFTGRTFGHLLNALPVMAAGVVAMINSSWLAVFLYSSAALALIGLFATLHYLNFYYIQERDRFLIREGVLSRNRIELPFSKIQNINIKLPFYFRPLGLVVLSMDSAGSAQKEVEIAALSLAQANRIKTQVMNYQRDVVADETPPEPPNEVASSLSAPLISRTTRDILIHGFTNNRAWIFLAFAAPILGQLNHLLLNALTAAGLDVQQWLASGGSMAFMLLLLAAVVVVFVLTSLFSVLGSTLALFDYQLWFRQNTYTRISGLFNRYEIQVKRSRVQTLKLAQSGLDLLFARSTLTLEPFSASGVDQHRSQFMQKILVPSLTQVEIEPLLGHVYPGLQLEQVTLYGISPLYLVRKMITLVVPSVLVIIVLTWREPLVAVMVGSAATFILLLLSWLRWLRYGFGLWRGYIVLRTGLIGRTYICLPVHKVQQVKVLQSLFLKRRGLASLQLVASSRAVTLPFISSKKAHYIMNMVLAEVELSESSWM